MNAVTIDDWLSWTRALKSARAEVACEHCKLRNE